MNKTLYEQAWDWLVRKGGLMPFFEPGLVYPSDPYGGRYVEVEGPVVKVDGSQVTIDSDQGWVSGFLDDFRIDRGMIPSIGDLVSIRVCDGWRSDNMVCGWRRPVPPKRPDPVSRFDRKVNV